MQIYNTPNYSNPSFGANKIATVTRIANELPQFEKYDIYRLNEQDVPFAKKLIACMDKYKSRLGEMHEKLSVKLKEFCENPDLFLHGMDNKEKIYLGIKNDNYIDGFVSMRTSYGGRQYIENAYSSRKDSPLEGGFIIGLMNDKKSYGYELGGRKVCGWNGCAIRENSKYWSETKIGKEELVKSLNPDYKIEAVGKQSVNYDLEEILDV